MGTALWCHHRFTSAMDALSHRSQIGGSFVRAAGGRQMHIHTYVRNEGIRKQNKMEVQMEVVVCFGIMAC
jgi:hypothetical protein